MYLNLKYMYMHTYNKKYQLAIFIAKYINMNVKNYKINNIENYTYTYG